MLSVRVERSAPLVSFSTYSYAIRCSPRPSSGVHNGELPFSAADCYNKNVHIQFGRCPARYVFDEALQALIRNKGIIEKMEFIDLVLPGLDESAVDAVRRFERAEYNKVVFKPNGS